MRRLARRKFPLPPRLSFSQLPTPLEVLPLSPAPRSGIELFIKRDDLTGSILSGNKVRKLEFIFYDLLAKNAKVVITCGAVQSNHCRAVAALCATAGLKCHLILKGRKPPVPDGNYLLSRMFGARTSFITAREYENEVDQIMRRLARRYQARGIKPYVIPEGGSDPLGVWGYIKAAQELKQQAEKAGIMPDFIATSVGSGGTYAGLYLASKMMDWAVKIVGFSANRKALYFQKKIFDICVTVERELQTDLAIEPSEIDIDERFIGPGYGRIDRREADFIRRVAANSGVALDPVYTGKALLGLFTSIAQGEFPKGSKIVFIHTGGQWGIFPLRRKLSPE